MAVFPTLTVTPSIEGWGEELAQDPTIRTQLDGGYILTRARFTRIPKKWKVKYGLLTPGDKATIEAFETTVQGGAGIFSWTSPAGLITYSVRFAGPIMFTMRESPNWWDAEFILEQV
ncbi:MAG: hypothetical protein BWX92_02796 [Deltaproteobacteria bacterium ADurb.Bin135]|nr:MAG: hypothetical protein BWX92_02796 [Deltaproteobacteria bacterium ADurb.Bin135]